MYVAESSQSEMHRILLHLLPQVQPYKQPSDACPDRWTSQESLLKTRVCMQAER